MPRNIIPNERRRTDSVSGFQSPIVGLGYGDLLRVSRPTDSDSVAAKAVGTWWLRRPLMLVALNEAQASCLCLALPSPSCAPAPPILRDPGGQLIGLADDLRGIIERRSYTLSYLNFHVEQRNAGALTGKAYIGHQAPNFAAKAVNVTFSLTDDSKLAASPEDNVSWSKDPIMYIGAEVDDVKTVGFVSEDEIPQGVTVKGFGLFGGWAYNKQKSGAIEMNFIATPTNEHGLYQVKWNAASTKVSGDHIPVSLRTEAPATPEN
ncbi:hypothetical protein OPT61_g4980 [Boeremia exigua]|uniref:Uncharacterized protein n=1 Tax=Boeremia exigua TaxID=749465 RepID=A0ACC2IC73_9PLEO|nr:hypothetical protein OPT61_g4980 [Boeremia exigua]